MKVFILALIPRRRADEKDEGLCDDVGGEDLIGPDKGRE